MSDSCLSNHAFFQTAAQEWIQRVKCAKAGCDISKELVRDIHDIQTQKHQGCSALTGALIGLTLNTLMPGFGGTIMATMGRAALVVLAGKATTSLADNRGDLGKVLDDLASAPTFKSMAVSVGTAGTSSFLSQSLPTTSTTWLAEAGRQILQEGTKSLMRGIVWQERPELDQLALNVVAGTLQTMGAKAVGQAKAVEGIRSGPPARPGLNYVEHKLGHFIVAAGAESVRSLSIRSLKSGDIVTNMIIAGSSAAMAEVLVEAWADVKGVCEKVYRENPCIEQPEFIAKVQAETSGSRTAAHLVTSALAGVGMELANPGSGAASLHVASNAAQTALDNNFIPGAIVLASMAWSAYKTWDTARTFCDYWETYMTGGLEAVTAKAAQDGAMRLIFGGAFKVGKDLVMKVGGRLYRLCPEGVQVLGEQGYEVVYKAVEKAEGHAFYKKAVQKEKEWFGRAGVANTNDAVRRQAMASERKLAETAEPWKSQYWSSPKDYTFKGQTNKVYQRNDLIDPNHVSQWRDGGKIYSGTNVERMASGRSPIGADGKPLHLHHTIQKHDGPLVEITSTFHNQHSRIIHVNPQTVPSGINRASFDEWRKLACYPSLLGKMRESALWMR